MNGGIFRKATPKPFSSPIATQLTNVTGSAQVSASFDPLVNPAMIIPAMLMTTPIERSIPPRRITNPWPYDATTRKIEVVRIAAICWTEPKLGFYPFITSIMSVAANNTSNAVNVSGFNVAKETSERVPVSFITSS